MKRKCAQTGASPLTCCSQSKYWSYLLKQRVALMLQRLCGRGVGHGKLPHQFPTYGPFGEPKGDMDYIKTRWGCGCGKREIGRLRGGDWGKIGRDKRDPPETGGKMKEKKGCEVVCRHSKKHSPCLRASARSVLTDRRLGAKLSFHHRTYGTTVHTKPPFGRHAPRAARVHRAPPHLAHTVPKRNLTIPLLQMRFPCVRKSVHRAGITTHESDEKQ